jgi:predicted Zn-dependent peptidase
MKKVLSKNPYTLKTLPSGLRIMTIPMKTTTTTVLVLVEAGSKYETKKENGISHFLEHMCFKGTTNRPNVKDIPLELDVLGAQYNAFTGQEYTGYYAKGRAADTTKLISVVSDLFVNPILPKEEIEKEKGVICDEINMYEDMPQHKVYYTLLELLYGDQAAGRTIAGSKDNVRSFTKAQIVTYRNKHYTLGATLVVVAGNIDTKKVEQQVTKEFKAATKGKARILPRLVQKQTQPEIKIEYKKTDQTHILIGFRSEKDGHKDNIAISFLSGVLGLGMSSRLFTEVRDKMGVGYYVGAHNDTSKDSGIFVLSAGVAPERATEVVTALLSECKRLMTEPVSKDEMQKVINMRLSGMAMGLESTNAVANFYGEQAIVREKIETPESIKKKLESVTSEEVMKVAKKLFTKSNINLAIVGPHKNTKDFSKILADF